MAPEVVPTTRPDGSGILSVVPEYLAAAPRLLRCEGRPAPGGHHTVGGPATREATLPSAEASEAGPSETGLELRKFAGRGVLAEEARIMRTLMHATLLLVTAGTAGSTQALDGQDWDALEDTAQYSLEFARTEESVPWVNPDTGTEGTFTPVTTHEGPEGQVCREYAVEAIIDGREEIVYGTACRRPDGSWVEANAEYTETEPPAAETEVYSGTDWSWIIRTFAIAGGYCSSNFCVGGRFGSYYPSWFYPWAISFNYWDYGRWGYYYPYPYYAYYYPYSSYYCSYGHHHHRYPYRSQYVHHHRKEHRDHYRDRHTTTHRDGHPNRYRDRNDHHTADSKRTHVRSRRYQRERSTHTQPRIRSTRSERYTLERTADQRSGDERNARIRSKDRRSREIRETSSRTLSRRPRDKHDASNRSIDQRSGERRKASSRALARHSERERKVSSRSTNQRPEPRKYASNRPPSRRAETASSARNRSGRDRSLERRASRDHSRGGKSRGVHKARPASGN